MKKLILSLTLAGAAALAAKASTVASANTFGVLKIASGTEQTIIGVPWVAVSAGNSAVNATNLVMASNLADNDMLYYYDSAAGNYKAWVVNNKACEPTKSAQEQGGKTVVTDSPSIVAPRGSALILVRQTAEKSNPIYLYGQYLEATSLEPALQTSPNSWNLIAPANTSTTPYDLNSDMTWENVDPTDRIRVASAAGRMITLKYIANTGWVVWDDAASTPGYVTTYSKIQPGQGAWFIKGDNSAETTVAINATPGV